MIGPVLASSVPLIIGIVVGLGLEAVLVVFAIRNWTRYRLIEDTPTTPVESLSPGLREAQGAVVALGDSLQSPMGHKACVYYHFKVEEERIRRDSDGDTRRTWHTVVNDRQHAHCGVDDGTGFAEIDIQNAELKLNQDQHKRSGLFNSASSDLEAALNERYGRSSKGFIFNKSMRYTETVLEEGDRLYVLGDVEMRDDRPPVFKKGEHPLIVSDKGEAGVSSSYKWTSIGCWAGAVVVLAIGITLLVMNLG
ncbi:MAG: GIDE domain-containing protein [Planctomycetota bacterium]